MRIGAAITIGADQDAPNAAGHPVTEQRPERRRRPSWCAPDGACHGTSAITAGLDRGGRPRTPVLLGVS
jgi:hypothetical protein